MNVFRKVTENLPGRWAKGTFADSQGNLCGWGHMMSQIGNHVNEKGEIRPEFELVSQIAGEQFPDRAYFNTIDRPHFPRFNDHQDTTEEDVLLVMEKAAIQWEEIHGG